MSREETHKILSWLCSQSTSGSRTSLENALSRRLPGTGRWFVASEIFIAWIASKQSSIWITDLPGSGKTLLCASAIKEIFVRKDKKVAVLYFFCDHRDPSKVSHDNFVMTLARQLFEHSPELMDRARRIYDEKADDGDRPFKRADYAPLIESIMGQFESVYILCDALDEAAEGDEIANTLERLLSYGIRFNHSIKVLLTSRFDVQLERRHDLITANRVALAENMKPDIEQYINKEVENRIARGTLKLRNKVLQSLIQKRVTSRAGT